MFVIGRGRYARQAYPEFPPPRLGVLTSPVQQATAPGGSQATWVVEIPPFKTSIGNAVKLTLLATGLTTAPGDVVSIIPTMDGASLGPDATQATVNSGATGLFTIGMTWVVIGVPAGANHTYGFRLANSTLPNTIAFSATNGAYILVEEVPLILSV